MNAWHWNITVWSRVKTYTSLSWPRNLSNATRNLWHKISSCSEGRFVHQNVTFSGSRDRTCVCVCTKYYLCFIISFWYLYPAFLYCYTVASTIKIKNGTALLHAAPLPRRSGFNRIGVIKSHFYTIFPRWDRGETVNRERSSTAEGGALRDIGVAAFREAFWRAIEGI